MEGCFQPFWRVLVWFQKHSCNRTIELILYFKYIIFKSRNIIWVTSKCIWRHRYVIVHWSLSPSDSRCTNKVTIKDIEEEMAKRMRPTFELSTTQKRCLDHVIIKKQHIFVTLPTGKTLNSHSIIYNTV